MAKVSTCRSYDDQNGIKRTIVEIFADNSAGKTTITNLINRFYEVQGGGVTYDGIDVRDIKKDSLRRSLGMALNKCVT